MAHKAQYDTEQEARQAWQKSSSDVATGQITPIFTLPTCAHPIASRITHAISPVEVDSTFYHLQSWSTFERWAFVTPPDFAFNVKAFGALTLHERDDFAGC